MNVYLIGMPGSGKSSVGRDLAARLGLLFVDLDEDAERAAGKPVAAIFAEDGEAAFRREETGALARAAHGDGSVVACGGGTPLDAENRALMSATGRVVFLSVPLEVLGARVRPAEGRPLIAQEGDLERLFAQRDGIYRSAADHVVDATGPAAEIAEQVAKALR